MKIVLNINVLVPALLSAFGPSAWVLDLLLAGEVRLADDDRILAEYRQVLVTGNRRHFPEAVCGSVQVLSPAEFLVWWQEHAAER